MNTVQYCKQPHLAHQEDNKTSEYIENSGADHILKRFIDINSQILIIHKQKQIIWKGTLHN